MSEWRTDERYRQSIGPFEMVPERHKGGGTAHLVTFPDGNRLRVGPDDATSGQARAMTITRALTEAAQVAALDIPADVIWRPMVYLIGYLTSELGNVPYEVIVRPEDCAHDLLEVTSVSRSAAGTTVSIICQRCRVEFIGRDVEDL